MVRSNNELLVPNQD